MKRKRSIETDILGLRVGERGINSNRKGGDNERMLAGVLSAWTGLEFTRVPRSGGLRWAQGQGIYGDVICTDQQAGWKWLIETKHLKDGALTGDYNGRCRSKVLTIWDGQVLVDIERAGNGMEPLMFLRVNGMPAAQWIIYMHAHYTDLMLSKVARVFHADNGCGRREKSIIGVKSDEFFDKISYDTFRDFR